MPGRREALVFILERVLVVVGVVCLGYVGYAKLEAQNFQREQQEAYRELLAGASGASGARVAPSRTSSHLVAPGEALREAPDARDGREAREAREAPANGVLGVIEIPRLRVSSPVLSGDGKQTLAVAVGHLPDTPTPWEGGNTAVAAHRDGLFRPLRNVRIGDDVRVRSTRGDFLYRVRSTKVVTPDDLSVLEPTGTDTLTLITCYPFNYVGNAPKRFIVQAERVGAAPASATAPEAVTAIAETPIVPVAVSAVQQTKPKIKPRPKAPNSRIKASKGKLPGARQRKPRPISKSQSGPRKR